MQNKNIINSPRVGIRPFLKNLRPSATLLINERSKTLMAEGKKVYRLGFGQSPFPIPSEVINSLQRHAHEKDYLPVRGLPALRKAVAQFNQRTLGIECSAEDIMIGPGSKELILGLQMACDADLILPSPSWVSYEPQAHIAQKKVIWVETEEKEKWLLTPEKLQTAIQQNSTSPKILLLNYPSNPIGATYQDDQLKQLAEVARQNQILIVADEIYGELTFSRSHISMAKYYPEGTIISSGLSKWCGAGGWRLGTFTFPKAYRNVLDTMATLASESFSSVSAPVQYAAITAFEGSDSMTQYLNDSKKILQTIGAYVHQSLTAAGVTMPEPEGGFYLFPNFEFFREKLNQKGIYTSTDLCEKMLEESGVALLPGVAFGRPEDEFTCRLSYVDFDGKSALEFVNKNVSKPLGIDFLKSHCPRIIEAIQALKGWLSN
jgi:aspartate aminotransferase